MEFLQTLLPSASLPHIAILPTNLRVFMYLPILEESMVVFLNIAHEILFLAGSDILKENLSIIVILLAVGGIRLRGSSRKTEIQAHNLVLVILILQHKLLHRRVMVVFLCTALMLSVIVAAQDGHHGFQPTPCLGAENIVPGALRITDQDRPWNLFIDVAKDL